MAIDRVEALERVSLLGGLSKRELKRLARDFSENSFPAGSVVVEQGQERGMGFFVIAEGEAAVTVNGVEVATLGPGDHFGEIALISDRVRTATVTAVTDLHCLVITVWEFRAFVQSNADVAWELLEYLALLLYEERAGKTSLKT